MAMELRGPAPPATVAQQLLDRLVALAGRIEEMDKHLANRLSPYCRAADVPANDELARERYPLYFEALAENLDHIEASVRSINITLDCLEL